MRTSRFVVRTSMRTSPFATFEARTSACVIRIPNEAPPLSRSRASPTCVRGIGMGHGVTEYTCRMILRRVSGLGFVISTLNNAGDRPYPENSGGREIDPSGSWYPSDESPGLRQLPKPSWHLTCQTALSAHPLRAPACARPYTCAMPKPPRAPPGAPPRPVVRASPPSHRAPVGRPG